MPIYLHPYPISFLGDHNLDIYPNETTYQHSVQQFAAAVQNKSAETVLALVTGFAGYAMDTGIFTLALLETEDGKMVLVMWGSEGPWPEYEGQHPGEWMNEMQYVLVSVMFCTFHLETVWYNVDRSHSGQGSPLLFALHWIQFCSQFQNRLYEEEEDERVVGCVDLGHIF